MAASTILEAARLGLLEEIERLIADGHPVDAHDNRGWSALHEAVAANSAPCMHRLLLEGRVDVNAQSFEGTSPLLLACKQNNIEAVEILLKAKAKPNIPDHMNNFPLHEAVKFNNFSIVQLLVSNGSVTNCQTYCGTSPLHICAVQGLLNIAKFLLNKGASLETKEEYNITCIFTAAQFGQEECLSLLLKHAFHIGRKDLTNYPAEDGATPLYLAAQEGYSNCVHLLLEYGADANIMTSNHPKALPVQAALEFEHLEYVF